MGLRKLGIVICIVAIALVAIVGGVARYSYVDNYYQGHSLKNISNITISGIFTSGDLLIKGGLIWNASQINATALYQNGAPVLTASSIDNGTIIRAGNTSWVDTVIAGTASLWDNANFSTAYAADTGRWDYTNYSGITDRWQTDNFTSSYDGRSGRWDYENFSGLQVTVSEINLTILRGTNISGQLYWTNISHYPAACPSDTYVTAINDSVTCTSISDVYLSNTGDSGSGSYKFNGSVQIKELNATGNITQTAPGKHCFDIACNSSIYYNGTALIIGVN